MFIPQTISTTAYVLYCQYSTAMCVLLCCLVLSSILTLDQWTPQSHSGWNTLNTMRESKVSPALWNHWFWITVIIGKCKTTIFQHVITKYCFQPHKLFIVQETACKWNLRKIWYPFQFHRWWFCGFPTINWSYLLTPAWFKSFFVPKDLRECRSKCHLLTTSPWHFNGSKMIAADQSSPQDKFTSFAILLWWLALIKPLYSNLTVN